MKIYLPLQFYYYISGEKEFRFECLKLISGFMTREIDKTIINVEIYFVRFLALKKGSEQTKMTCQKIL